MSALPAFIHFWVWDRIIPFCLYGTIILLSTFVVFAYFWEEAKVVFFKRRDDDE